MKRTLAAMIAFIAVQITWIGTPAQAAEITILVNQGALSGVRDLAAGYEKASGNKVVVDLRRRSVAGGENQNQCAR